MLLTNLGGRLAWTPPAQKIVTAAVSDTMLQVSELFAATLFARAKPNATDWVSIFMLGVWAIVFAAIMCIRLPDWFRIRAAVRNSVPMDVQNGNQGSLFRRLEPGVVGLFRPILLLPADIVRC